jgi:hypothetical protein
LIGSVDKSLNRLVIFDPPIFDFCREASSIESKA